MIKLVVLVVLCLHTDRHGTLCREVPLPRNYVDLAACELSAHLVLTEWLLAVRQVYGPDYYVRTFRCGPAPPSDPDAE